MRCFPLALARNKSVPSSIFAAWAFNPTLADYKYCARRGWLEWRSGEAQHHRVGIKPGDILATNMAEGITSQVRLV